jgi:hypothetical protein
MNPIAIFYHAIFTGGSTPIATEHACHIGCELMIAIRQSGLAAEVSSFIMGVNGPDEDLYLAKLFTGNAKYFAHGAGATTEIPTLRILHEWAITHPGHYVLYLHTKGASRPALPLWTNWRRCMAMACVWRWRQCVQDLDAGADAVGCHWLTPERHGDMIKRPYFAGTFWWAKSEFLATLPPLPPAEWKNRFVAESWIGLGPVLPKIIDYHPVSHWYAGNWDCSARFAP